MSVMTAQAKNWSFEQNFICDVSLHNVTVQEKNHGLIEQGKHAQKYNRIIYVYFKELGP